MRKLNRESETAEQGELEDQQASPAPRACQGEGQGQAAESKRAKIKTWLEAWGDRVQLAFLVQAGQTYAALSGRNASKKLPLARTSASSSEGPSACRHEPFLFST